MADTVVPYLFYEDVVAALEFLDRAFGFTEKLRVPRDDGSIMHAEMSWRGGRIMLGNPGPDYRSPRRAGHVTGQLYVTVDDAEKHWRRAVEAGAEIVSEPEEKPYGALLYEARDVEGHEWSFAQPT
jgi:uncharacterized glyoxalase superfamily protein PhnB